jgi:hypothetical protein
MKTGIPEPLMIMDLVRSYVKKILPEIRTVTLLLVSLQDLERLCI